MGLKINLEMMRTSLLIIIFTSCLLVFLEAHSMTKKQKKLIRKFRKVRAEAYDFENEMATLNSKLEDVEKQVSVSNRHIFGTDALAVVDATFTGNQCGPFTLTTWSILINWYNANGANTDSGDPFNGGTFTSPINGWYHICSFSRFKKGGNANDVTVKVSGSAVAAYGSGITEDWLTTGVCFDAYLALNTQVTVVHESGGSSDCIESTWPHNKFTVHTIGNGNP